MLNKKLLFISFLLIIFTYYEHISSKEMLENNSTKPTIETTLSIKSREKFGFGFLFPFPTGIEFSITTFDIGIGIIHTSITNLFSKEFMFHTYTHYIFSDLYIVNAFFFLMGVGLFLEIGKITEIYEQKYYSGISYKIGLSIPFGIKYKALNDTFEINAKYSIALFIGQNFSEQFIFPIRGDLSVGIKVWIKN
ncbi:DUF3996 domain-containing protein [Borrelia sp. A-FGy1]|uniref:BAPKO_0422 family outer member beta-barrel protein n=1 Tax=Borrelia sp. A-FGy1 TaxID=2608247 RepID=UPI0015F653DF|nr:DUF3996 domain-containing protein [Borrelia sp. A-FGy1]QMU99330.1 DUF3996 domain-containing protein [Borrelia sp. A-FGy1]